MDECKPLRAGGAGAEDVGIRPVQDAPDDVWRHGRAVQLDPIEPILKAHGTNRLELQHEKMLSSFPFNFNLRRYNMGVSSRDNMPRDDHAAGAYTRPPLSST